MQNQTPSHQFTSSPIAAQTGGVQEPHFTPLHAYIKEQFGGPREAARQFQEIMDEMVNMATMRDEYVCTSPFRFATLYGHLHGLSNALDDCAGTNA